MRKGILASLFLSLFLFVSCSKEDCSKDDENTMEEERDCRKCILGMNVLTNVYCDNGDGTVEVQITRNDGWQMTRTYENQIGSFEDYINNLVEFGDYVCDN